MLLGNHPRLPAGWSGALPAVVVGALAVGFAASAELTPGASLAAAYMREGRRAFGARDYETARICYERLAASPSAPAEAVWSLAETYEATGKSDRASSLWDRLAPPDRPGYAPAQLRRAHALLKTPAAGPLAAKATAAAEAHLRRALDSAPGSVEANALLGRLLIATGRPGQAAPLLARAAAQAPGLRMAAALAYAADGQRDYARFVAEQARGEAAAALAAAPDDFDARLRLAKAAVFLGDHARAAEALRRGFERSRDPRYRSPLTEVYAAWSDAQADDDGAGPALRLILLEEGLRIDPNSGPLLERFGRVLGAGGAHAGRARQALRELLAGGRGGAGAHFALGLDAWQRGEADAARAHLEAAARLNPNGPAIANNLSWALAHGPDPDLPRALSLVNLALDRQPAHPQFRGTRGAVLTRLGRWKEALADLEAALTTIPNDPELHRDLADTYEHLGLPDMAAAHRRRVASP